MAIIPGFRGTVRVYDGISVDFYFRVSSIDIAVRREAQPFLPVYGGVDLKRIWHTGTGDINITVSGPLVKGLFEKLRDISATTKELTLEITYYGGEGRRATGCLVNTFSVSVDAGEVASFTVNMIAKLTEPFSLGDRTYTKGEKLLTWDKCLVSFPDDVYLDKAVQSFTYNINNDIKSIKTSESLFPSILVEGVQDISGQITFYDIVFPHRGTYEYSLGFENVTFVMENVTLQHEVVFNPTENVPLVPGPVVSTVTWIKSNVGTTVDVAQE